MESTYYASQDELRLILNLIAVETKQVVQVQSCLRTLHQRSISTARRQVGVAQCSIRSDLVEINIHTHKRIIYQALGMNRLRICTSDSMRCRVGQNISKCCS